MNTTEFKVDAVAAEYPAVRVIAEQASEWLTDVVANSPDPVHAEWSGFYDPKSRQPMVTLRLSTPGVDVHAAGVYTLPELADQERAKPRLLMLFSAFMRQHIRRFLNLATAAS